MASNSPIANLEMSNERVVAFFRVREDAFRAISELKENDFTPREIGVMSKAEVSNTEDVDSGPDLQSAPAPIDAVASKDPADRDEVSHQHSESVWEKLKHFFAGDSSDDVDYHDSTSSFNWNRPRGEHYYRGISEGGAIVTVTGARTEEAREILQDSGGDLRAEGFEGSEYAEPASEYGEAATLRGEALGDAASDSVLDDDELGERETEDDVSTRRPGGYRVQVRGEVLRSYLERTKSRETPFQSAPVGERAREDRAVNPSGDWESDDRDLNTKNPAA